MCSLPCCFLFSDHCVSKCFKISVLLFCHRDFWRLFRVLFWSKQVPCIRIYESYSSKMIAGKMERTTKFYKRCFICTGSFLNQEWNRITEKNKKETNFAHFLLDIVKENIYGPLQRQVINYAWVEAPMRFQFKQRIWFLVNISVFVWHYMHNFSLWNRCFQIIQFSDKPEVMEMSNNEC